MKVIVGLGNPGKEYEKTRHNAGFLAVDLLLAQYGFDQKKVEHQAITYTKVINGEKVLFVKPQTYMNNSGQSVSALLHYYKVEVEDLLVIYDDKDFSIGQNQFRFKGSAGGHNGMKSIIQHLKTEEIKRLRIGIGQPGDPREMVDWVLSQFGKVDFQFFQASIKLLLNFVDDWTKGEGFNKIMSRYNILFK
jgi:peptidyl-tRNA hydrolase, PTH1 family